MVTYDLAGMVENDDLGIEGIATLGGIVLRVSRDITTPNFLDCALSKCQQPCIWNEKGDGASFIVVNV